MFVTLKSKYFLFVVLFGLFISLPIQAATINFGPNGCTFQDAIRSANNDASLGNCSTGSGYDFLISPDVWEITLSSRLPTITSDMSIITATESGLLILLGDNDFQIMKVSGADTNLTMSRLIFSEGTNSSGIEDDGGGAIKIVDANVHIIDSAFFFNSSSTDKGGAIYIEDGELSIQNVFFQGNLARYRNTPATNRSSSGGAIFAKDSVVNINEGNFYLNRAESIHVGNGNEWTNNDPGGSVFMERGELNVTNSLIRGEFSGIHGDSTVATIVNSTFAKSVVNEFKDMLIFSGFSAVDLNHVTMVSPFSLQGSSILSSVTNTIFDHYCRIGPSATVIYSSHNIASESYSCNINSIDHVEAELFALRNNGGATSTHALHHTSPAIDAGDPSFCLPTDQRGESRGALCDIGAFEITGVADVDISGTFMQSMPYVSDQMVVYNLKIKNNGPSLATDVELDINSSGIFVSNIDSTLCPAFPCIIPSIQANQEIILPLTMIMGNHFNSPFEMTFSADTTASSLYTDFDLNNNTTSGSLPINQGADMGIDMTLLTAEPYFIGQTIIYEATINNNGQETASTIKLEFIPTGLNNIVFDNCSSIVGQVCIYPNLMNNESGVVTIKAEITATLFDASAEISSGLIDVNDSNNIDSTQNNGAVTEADISIDVNIEQSEPYYAYQYLEFNVKIINGNSPASNVHVYSDFPEAEYIGASGCSFPCIIPSMAANSVQNITLQYFAPAEVDVMNNTFIHHILVTPAQTDPNMSNNEIAIEKSIIKAADVASNLTLTTVGPYFVGQSVQYELQLGNNGVSHATDLDIVLLPENLTLNWAASDNCETVDCNLSNLDRFLTENITLDYKIDAEGAFDLSANVIANELDIFPNNNIDDSGNGGTASLNENDMVFKNSFEME